MNKEIIEKILRQYDKDTNIEPLSDLLYKHYAEAYEFEIIENEDK